MRAAGAALVVAACFDPAFTDETRCSPTMECPAPRICVAGRCVLGGGGPDAAGSDAAGSGDARDNEVLITIDKAEGASGKGTVTLPDGACDAECPSLERTFGRTTGSIIAVARPDPGSYFQGWEGACTGALRVCTLQLTTDRRAVARFAAITANLMFATSVPFEGATLALAGADILCASEAAGAGLTETYRAVLSSGTTSAISRLVVPGTSTPPRGFVRMDGLPIADTLDDLVVSHRILFPVAYDENGKPAEGAYWSGASTRGGISGADCVGWTSGSLDGIVGNINGGGTLLNGGSRSCGTALPLLCVMTTRVTQLSPPRVDTGNVIFLSDTTFAGDEVLSLGFPYCSGKRPGARPLVGGAGILDADTLYVRPDGVAVGTGAEIAAGRLRTGIWVASNGLTVELQQVWTGSSAYGQTDAADGCGVWTTTSGMATMGAPAGDGTWWSVKKKPCGDHAAIYCVLP